MDRNWQALRLSQGFCNLLGVYEPNIMIDKKGAIESLCLIPDGLFKTAMHPDRGDVRAGGRGALKSPQTHDPLNPRTLANVTTTSPFLIEEMFELAGEELEREFGVEPEMARAAPNPDGDAPGNALFGLTPGAERDDYAFTPGEHATQTFGDHGLVGMSASRQIQPGPDAD